MTLAIDELPDDVAALKRLFVEERRERERMIDEERQQRDSLIVKIREEAARQLEAERQRHAAE